jgi:hypothetical protein
VKSLFLIYAYGRQLMPGSSFLTRLFPSTVVTLAGR